MWDGLHCLPIGQPAPCTALAVCDEGGGAVGGASGGVTVVTGGEDGRIVVLRSDDTRPLRVIGKWESRPATELTSLL